MLIILVCCHSRASLRKFQEEKLWSFPLCFTSCAFSCAHAQACTRGLHSHKMGCKEKPSSWGVLWECHKDPLTPKCPPLAWCWCLNFLGKTYKWMTNSCGKGNVLTWKTKANTEPISQEDAGWGNHEANMALDMRFARGSVSESEFVGKSEMNPGPQWNSLGSV